MKFLLLFELEKKCFFMNIWVTDRKENIKRKRETKRKKAKTVDYEFNEDSKTGIDFFLAWKLNGTFKFEFP